MPRENKSPSRTARAAAAIVLGAAATAQAGIEYELTILPPLPGGAASHASNINDQGTIVGSSSTTDTLYENAVCWINRQTIDLTGLGISGANALGINEAGMIVGQTDELGSNAFQWNNGLLQALEMPGTCCSKATAVNDSGIICGQVPLSAIGTRRAVIWEDGEWISLGTLGGNSSSASDINSSGQVVGNASISGTESRAYAWEQGVMTGLPVPDGFMGNTHATGINDQGTIVGFGNWIILQWKNGEVTTLEALPGLGLGYAMDINNDEIVVGMSYGDGFDGTQACRWIDGEVVNLNALVDGGDWTLYEAKAINSHGHIVGHAYSTSGEFRGFLLAPINEPCPGDFSGDGVVNVQDLLAVIAGWGDPWDVNDLLEVISNWGSCP